MEQAFLIKRPISHTLGSGPRFFTKKGGRGRSGERGFLSVFTKGGRGKSIDRRGREKKA